MVRDTSAGEDQATHPDGVDVRPLRDAADDGLLDRRDPRHFPGWALDDPTPDIDTEPDSETTQSPRVPETEPA